MVNFLKEFDANEHDHYLGRSEIDDAELSGVIMACNLCQIVECRSMYPGKNQLTLLIAGQWLRNGPKSELLVINCSRFQNSPHKSFDI